MASGIIRAAIFDFDGLILDTEVPDYTSWVEEFEALGCSLPFSVWAPHIGMTPGSFDIYRYLEAQLGRPVDRRAVGIQRRRRYLDLVLTQRPLPGVEESIFSARKLGVRLGVASNSDRRWVTGHLARLGLDGYFEYIGCRDDVQRTKPDPAVYLNVLRGLNVHPSQAVAFEDSPNGVMAAKRAGMFCVAIPNALTSELSLHEADLRLHSLSDTPFEELLLRVEEGLR